MKRVWAPWRIQYIRGPKEKGCIFCFPAKQDGARLVLRREKRALVMLNKYPYTGGHLMVVPTRHVSRPQDLAPADFAALTELLRKSVRALEQALQPQGLNVGMNLGQVAGAGVADHIHFHVVPRWNGDHNFMAVVSEVRVINEYLEETAELLRPAFRW
jgi:ATP adenylyltransferase